MPVRVLSVESTPNPNARKFICSRQLAAVRSSHFSPESAASDPLAAALFALPGVVAVMTLGDFITVTKTPESKWPDLVKSVRATLSSHPD